MKNAAKLRWLALLLLFVTAAALVALRLSPARAVPAAATEAATAAAAPEPEETPLPRAGSVPEALALFAPALKEGGTSFLFLTDGVWTAEDLNLLAAELVSNEAEIACETGYYHYDRASEPGGGERVCLEAEYRVDAELLQDRSLELAAVLDELAEQIAAGGGDARAQLLAAARAVTERADFDAALEQIDDMEKLSQEQRFQRSAYGALVAGRTVCTGYAMAFKALCDRLDLPCWVVSGTRGARHAWNAVLLDGETLFVDCTFADVLEDESCLFMTRAALAERGYALPDGLTLPWAA